MMALPSKPRLTLALTALLGLAASCQQGNDGDSEDEGDDSADTGESGETGDATGVTYYEEVAPILYENCLGCHVDGGIAPFRLETYEDAKTWSEQIVPAVQDRIMPPFLMDASGDCNTYLDSAWLSDDQIDTITQWLDDGLLEGDPANAPELPPPPEGLADATHVAQMAEAYTPQPTLNGEDDYRCFLIDPELAQDAFLTDYEIVPGDRRFVHHVVIFQATSDAGQAEAQAKDDADPEPGYTCFGDAGINGPTSMVAAWAPGRDYWEYPEGTGILVESEYPLILQMHYNVEIDDPPPDQSSVRFRFEDQVAKPMTSWFLVDLDLYLPPGQEQAISSQTATVGQMMSQWGVGDKTNGMELVGVVPHMHNRGRQLQLDNLTKETCYGYVPNWDFNWQLPYFFENPLPLDTTDELRITCSFDTTEDTDPVVWGEGTDDEMCVSVFFTSYQP